MNMMPILLLCFISMQSLESGESIINYTNVTYIYICIYSYSYNVTLVLIMGSGINSLLCIAIAGYLHIKTFVSRLFSIMHLNKKVAKQI